MIFKKHIKMNVFDSSLFKVTIDKKIIDPEDCQRYIDTICDNTTKAYILPSCNENSITLSVEGDKECMVDNIMLILRSWINKHYTKEVFERNSTLFIVTDLEKSDYEYKQYPSYFNLISQLSIVNQTNISKESFDDFVDNLNKDHQIKVIRYKYTNQIVGSITIFKENKIIHDMGKVAHIEDLVVDEAVRNYGLGKKLLDIAKRESEDCYKIILDCNNENIGFYEKCGFQLKDNHMVLYK
jgi:glucosamine-phosphate N-acetyltransferase